MANREISENFHLAKISRYTVYIYIDSAGIEQTR